MTEITKRLAEIQSKAHEQVEKLDKFIIDHLAEINAISDAFENIPGFVNIDVDRNNMSLDISFAGDNNILKQVFRAFRAMGYEPVSRPEKKFVNYSSWWYKHDEDGFRDTNAVKLWLSFASTVCKRVQVGTKTVEQPVYETQCMDGSDEAID